MKKVLFLIFSILIISCSKERNTYDYKILQFEGNDSINKHIAREVKYSKAGLIKFESYSGFKETKYIEVSDVDILHFYKDTLKIKTLKYYPNSIDADSVRIEYKYDQNKKLIQKTFFDYKKRLKGNIDFWKCTIDSTDFQPEATWDLLSRINIQYDAKGRKIETYAPNEHWDSQNHYLYQYDSLNRVIKETSLNHKDFIWEKFYDYNQEGYEVYINRDPTKEIRNKGDWSSIEKIKYEKDKSGNIVKETHSENGDFDFMLVRKFDKKDRVIREERFDDKHNLILTNIYNYE